MKISIVVPTYNEQSDIAATLDALVLLEWPDYEVLVVDDSTDNTPNIVAGYANQGVRLIRPVKREGRCGARNIGILESTGEVVVILNADVLLPKTFLTQISKHYKHGADYVLVRSKVENIGDVFGRYVECVSLYNFYDTEPKHMEWTEGFSCRRQLALSAGLFPTGYVVPICAGEDGVFGDNIRKLDARKVLDLNIVCTHIAPASLSEYWNIRKGRGQGGPQVRRFIEGWSFRRIILRAILRIIRTVIISLTLLPIFWINYRYAKKSPRGINDTIPFCWAWIIEHIAYSFGEWESILDIRRAEKKLIRNKSASI